MGLEQLSRQLEFVGRFSIVNASFADRTFDLSGQFSRSESVAFSTDGTRMFAVGRSVDSVAQYDLSTPFDSTSASFSGVTFDVSSEASKPRGLRFDADGTRMYVVGDSSDAVSQYSLTTPFDLSSASFSGTSFSVGSEDIVPNDVVFSTDGTQMFIAGGANDSIFQYALSTAFDVGTATFSGTSFDVSTQVQNTDSVAFNTDGSQMIVADGSSGNIFSYDLSTAFDVGTATFSNRSFDLRPPVSSPTALTFSDGGSRFYTVQSDSVFEYLAGQLTIGEDI